VPQNLSRTAKKVFYVIVLSFYIFVYTKLTCFHVKFIKIMQKFVKLHTHIIAYEETLLENNQLGNKEQSAHHEREFVP
jgi:hypothetical protein